MRINLATPTLSRAARNEASNNSGSKQRSILVRIDRDTILLAFRSGMLCSFSAKRSLLYAAAFGGRLGTC